MSYGPPNPRTPYGDQDFIKEDGPTGGPAFGAPLSPPLPPPPRIPSAPYANNQYPPQMSHMTPDTQGIESLQGGQLDMKKMENIAFNLTPEDQIFIQAFRRDSFYYRVLPLAVFSNGALYYYNYSKQLPHKKIPYIVMTVGSFLLGKMSYKSELARRLEANPSQTPFMAGLRRVMGVQSSLSSDFSSDMSQDYANSGFGSANAPLAPPPTVNSAYTRRGAPESMSPYGGAQPYSQGMQSDSQVYQPYDSSIMPNPSSTSNDGAPLSTTSYEELRARNRGLMPIK